jgi:hypothetical protein
MAACKLAAALLSMHLVTLVALIGYKLHYTHNRPYKCNAALKL